MINVMLLTSALFLRWPTSIHSISIHSEPNRILRAFGIGDVPELTPSELNFSLLLFVKSVKSWAQSILKIPCVPSGMQHMP